jgi:hypothetical protein
MRRKRQMTVSDILDTIKDIDMLVELYRRDSLNADHFDDLIDLIEDYREELLKKKVV